MKIALTLSLITILPFSAVADEGPVLITPSKEDLRPDLVVAVESGKQDELEAVYSKFVASTLFGRGESVQQLNEKIAAIKELKHTANMNCIYHLALIRLYENQKWDQEENDDNGVAELEKKIQQSFEELLKINTEELSNFYLLSLADSYRYSGRLAEANKANRLAYSNYLSKKDVSYKSDTVIAYAESVSEKGCRLYKSLVVDLIQQRKDLKLSKRTREKSLYALCKLHHTQGQWAEAIESGVEFLKLHKRSSKRLPVRFLLAQSYRSSGRLDEAMNHFGAVVQSAMGYFQYSCPAMIAILEMAWADGRKFEAWQAADDFLRATGKTFKKNQAKQRKAEKESWLAIKALRDAYALDPEVVKGIENWR